jgi:outer membrane receptor protein involved in Fe transport
VRTRNSGGYFGDRSTDSGTVSGYAALTAGPFGGVSVTGQLSRGFRDPVLSDRYFRGPTGRGFITGNPDLRAETSLQYEAALRYTSSRWRVAAHGFHYRIDDVIERYQTQTDFFFFRNRGRARVRGVELEAQASLPGRFSIEVAAHLMQGEVLDDGTHLDDVPPETITLRLRKDFGEKGYLLLRGAAYGEDQRPGPSEVAMSGYSLLDATAGYRFNKKIEIQLAGRNLIDRSYLVSPDVRAVQAPGTSVLATVLITF